MIKEVNLLNVNFFDELRAFIEAEVEHLLQAYKSKMQEKDEWLTIEETCNYIKVTEPTLWKYSKDGLLHKHYIGGNPRYKKSEVDKAFIKLLPKKGGSND